MLFSMIEKRLRRPCRGQIFEKFDKQVLLTKNEIQIDSPQEDSLGATQWLDGLRMVTHHKDFVEDHPVSECDQTEERGLGAFANLGSRG